MSAFEASCGLVLAAGAGTRYGSPKVLAENGRWLEAAVDALRIGGCVDVIVVLGAAITSVPDGARAVMNPDWSAGMGGSLRTGLRACRDTAAGMAVIMPVDTPDVGADVVVRVGSAARTTGLARAWFGTAPGHPVAMARRWWTAAEESAVGDEGARAFLAGRNDVVAVQCSDLATGRDHGYRVQ